MHVVIFTGGKLRPGKFVRDALAAANMIIAADSGAKTALAFQSIPSVVIGDFDSLAKAIQKDLAAQGARFIAHEREKDQTDTELAIDYAVTNQATRITVLGGIEGDRIDHILANIFFMTGSRVPVRFVNGSTEAWTVQGPAKAAINGQRGDRLSLIPLTQRVTKATSAGLKYILRAETLHMSQGRGVSNVMTRKRASISLSRGTLLLVHSAGNVRPE